MTEKFDTERLTQQQCAAELGVTTRTLREWQALSREAPAFSGLGPFPRNRDGTYHLKGVLCWLMLYRRKYPTAR